MARPESQSGGGDSSMVVLWVGTADTAFLLAIFLLRFVLNSRVGQMHSPLLTQPHLLFLPMAFFFLSLEKVFLLIIFYFSKTYIKFAI